MEQLIKVRSEEIDGDSFGNEWQVHYVLYGTKDDDGTECFDLYEDDGEGNGDFLARCYSMRKARSLTLRLGEFVEWGRKVAA